MQYPCVALVALSLLAVAFAQEPTCNPGACSGALQCHKQQHQKKIEEKACTERCATAAGVSQCFGEKRTEPDASFMACVEGKVCTAENIASAVERKTGRGDRGGKSFGKGGERGHKGGRGHGCDADGKGKLEGILGDRMTDSARRFEECVAGCRKCDEDQTECPDAEGCSMRLLKGFAMRSCQGSTGPTERKEWSGKGKGEGKSEWCKCIVQVLAPGAESACDEIADRKSSRGGHGKGGKGQRGEGKGPRGNRGEAKPEA